MPENVFDELRRYVEFDARDEEALRALHLLASPRFGAIADVFYRRVLNHEDARKALEGGESQVGRLKITLVEWMDRSLRGPWDDSYYELRCRIGRMHVRINLPQHYMFGAMNVIRRELNALVDEHYLESPERLRAARSALGKLLDIELAIMLHTYREDLLSQQARVERLSTFGQLVGSIGHELRNPLSVIETSLHILKGRLGGDVRTMKHAERIGEQVGLANRIISDLLDMIRDRPLSMERLSLAKVVEDAVGAVERPEAVSLRVGDLSPLPPLEGDAGQLRQALVNLVDNAVQAAGPRGWVKIDGAVREGAVEVAVEDSGPGVDEATRRRLFEPLITTKQKGVGLGLALVKRIVERHRGAVAYAPMPGSGARFVVRLPFPRV